MKSKIPVLVVALALGSALLAGDQAPASKPKIKTAGSAGTAECCDPSADPGAMPKTEK